MKDETNVHKIKMFNIVHMYIVLKATRPTA